MRSRVAAVAQLAVELVDEVAAVGEDQDAAGARGLDEAERGDGLAGAGRVLEPEALGGVRVLGRLGELRPRRRLVATGLVPVLRLLVGSSLVLVAPPRRGSPARRARRRLDGAVRRAAAPLPLPLRCASASSAVSVPESASTWWAESTVPSTRRGSSWREQRARARAAATTRGASGRRLLAARRRARPARRRARAGAAVPGASALAASSPSSRKARARSARRARSSAGGKGVAATATGVGQPWTARAEQRWARVRCASGLAGERTAGGTASRAGGRTLPRVHPTMKQTVTGRPDGSATLSACAHAG